MAKDKKSNPTPKKPKKIKVAAGNGGRKMRIPPTAKAKKKKRTA